MFQFIKICCSPVRPQSRIQFFQTLNCVGYTGIYLEHGAKSALINKVRSHFSISGAQDDTQRNVYSLPSECFHQYSKHKVISAQGCRRSKLLECSYVQIGGTNFQRFYSTNIKPPDAWKKNLMEFPLLVWPNVWQTIRNWMLIFFVVKLNHEPDFSIAEFCKASKHALAKISEILSRGDFEELEKFVEKKAIAEIKENFAKMAYKERIELAVDIEDVLFYFPYRIAVIEMDGDPVDRTYLEITMCYHLFRGFKELKGNPDLMNDPTRLSQKTDERVSIANYRFQREITKGSSGDWIVTILNHFKPVNLEPRF